MAAFSFTRVQLRDPATFRRRMQSVTESLAGEFALAHGRDQWTYGVAIGWLAVRCAALLANHADEDEVLYMYIDATLVEMAVALANSIDERGRRETPI